MTDILIIGAGPAGLTAAIYALRAGLSVVLLEAGVYGGQMALTNEIENYPGFRSISGAELSEIMHKQVLSMGGVFEFQKVTSVHLNGSIKIIKTDQKEYHAHSVIIANGLKRRTLGCRGEKEFSGRGVSYCAICDGAFFKDKNVLVIGGGNTAVEDAIYLSKLCKEVSLIVRKNYLRAEKYLCSLADERHNIKRFMESRLREIKGENVVKTAVIEDKNGNCREMPINGVFIAIGYEPDNEIYKGQVEMDKDMYFVSSEQCTTNIAGVFVAGDCRLKPVRQITTATADGAVAGSMAIRYVSELGAKINN